MTRKGVALFGIVAALLSCAMLSVALGVAVAPWAGFALMGACLDVASAVAFAVAARGAGRDE